MKKLLLTLAGSAAALALAPAAQAQSQGGTADNGGTIVIDSTGSSGTFGDATVSAGTFTNTFTFVTPSGFNLAGATISSIQTGGAATNIDFTSVTLNGVQFVLVEQGISEFRRIINQNLVAGATNTILVSGTSGGDASFSGTLSFAATSAVPEPATWAFMLIGFGAVGYSMRKRPAYKLAQAI